MNAPRRSASAARARRVVPALLVVGLAGAIAAIEGSGCQQSPVTVPVRSLEQSGKVSFVCLRGPTPGGAMDNVELPLSACTASTVDAVNQYTMEDDAGSFLFTDDAGNVDAGPPLPHLYALVTQTTRGEVAVVDTTARTASVLDQDPRIPGANFLHVGQKPVSIVSSPGSVATFVATAEIGRPGIFVLPSRQIRPASTFMQPDAAGLNGLGGAGGVANDPALSNQPIPQLTSFPACSLPSAPGEMMLINDPLDKNGNERKRCGGQHDTSPPASFANPPALDSEGLGRPKLVITMPDLGGIVVIDAQTLLEQPAGSFGPCPEEAFLLLTADTTGIGAAPPLPTGPACVNAAPQDPPLKPSYTPRPAGMTFANGTLYVGDLNAPVIHVIDLPTPCTPFERAPLLPTSLEDPSRVVTTSIVAAASAPTPDFKQYLYAGDVRDASVMVFDISLNSTTRRPLVRPHAVWDPFQPADRVRFTAPPADVIIVQRDVAEVDPTTGVAVAGVQCNPDPLAIICTDVSTSCDVGTKYRTVSTYDSEAGPTKLRGEFAFVALTNGKVAVIDIQDFDAPCRAPRNASSLFGCAGGQFAPCATSADCLGGASCGSSSHVCGAPPGLPLDTADDLSCNVVLPNAPRDANYLVANDLAGSHEPGIQTYPTLFTFEGTQLDLASQTAPVTVPMMVATLPKDYKSPGDVSTLQSPSLAPVGLDVGGTYTTIPDGPTMLPSMVTFPAGMIIDTGIPQHTLAMNLEDPRAHIAAQNWTVTFEGAMPGFDQRLSALRIDGLPAGTQPGVYDPDAHFCDNGVLSQKAVAEQQAASGLPDDSASSADYVQVLTQLPDQSDAFWTQNHDVQLCDFGKCLSNFGTTDTPTRNRDLRIVEAYQDHVEVVYRNDSFARANDNVCDPTKTDPHTQVNKACATGTCTNGVCACTKAGDCISGACDQASGLCLPTTHTLHDLQCCFPTAVQFAVRPGNQWLVSGDQSGFLHHVVPDPTTGVCRNSCDPLLARKNGRAPSVDQTKSPLPVLDGDPKAFINPLFRFAILQGMDANAKTVLPDRDLQFRFSNTGAFLPLQIALATDATTLVSPISISYVTSTGELAITDGSNNGLIMVSLATATVSRSFF